MSLSAAIPRLAILAVLAVAAGCATDPRPADARSAPPPAAAPPAAPAPYNELGRPDAPVTIVEYGDLQCPYCARHALQTFPELRRNYVDTGKLRYVARDLPLASHPQAIPAAVAARCAGEQGRFWEYRHALLLARARLGEETYAATARDLGLDLLRFEACRGDTRRTAQVQADAFGANARGLSGTPAFLIGRTGAAGADQRLVVGAKPYASFAAWIDALLAQ